MQLSRGLYRGHYSDPFPDAVHERAYVSLPSARLPRSLARPELRKIIVHQGVECQTRARVNAGRTRNGASFISAKLSRALSREMHPGALISLSERDRTSLSSRIRRTFLQGSGPSKTSTRDFRRAPTLPVIRRCPQGASILSTDCLPILPSR